MEFIPSPFEYPQLQLFKLTQIAYVHKYYVQFNAMANGIQCVMSEALLDCFIGGLKPDIRREVIAQTPTILIKCVSLAKLYEEKYLTKPKANTSNFNQKSQATKNMHL